MPTRTAVHSFIGSLAIAGMIGDCSQVAPPAAEDFTVATLASGLDTPWDLVWGPD